MSKKVYLELFHKWHFKPLLKRLEQVEKIEGIILLIGIDKILLNILILFFCEFF